MYRIGFGNDVHRLVEGRPLVLGGVQIESPLGADGHSDADALTHAITDAILGALALGDIGTHFPNSDERWRGAESFVFLRFAVSEASSRGYAVGNVDCTIEIERPRLAPYIGEMREGIAAALEVSPDAVSVKAKSGEGVDAVGASNAVRASAVVLLENR
jgi:2-C-methyl-D-erythritol 2,4-cyclodiphosphate synthase